MIPSAKHFRTLAATAAIGALVIAGVAPGRSGRPLALPAASAQTPEVVDPIEQTLHADNVYLDPALKTFDKAELEIAAVQGRDVGSRRTQTHIAVMKAPPHGITNKRQADAYVQRLHDNLELGNAPLIFLILNTSKQGQPIKPYIQIVAPEIKADRIEQLKSEFWPNVERDVTHPTPALARLAEQVAGDTNKTEYGNTWVMWIVFLVVVAVIGGLIMSAMRKKKQEMAQLRVPLDQLRSSVLSGIEYLDGYMDVLPKNNPDSDQVRIFRQAASNKYEQAAKIMDRATETSDLHRAQGLLDRAQADVDQARRYLDRATGGTGSIPGDDAMRPEPLPMSQSEVEAIPQNQRGVSFFSGQPAPLGSLQPVTITINGQSRQVLVTPEEADELRQGRMPQVRAFQQGNQWVPWYEYQAYDPYRDYWRYENNGWGGFGSGVIAGVVGAELLGGLLTPHYGYGSPWAFSTDNSYYQGYADAVQQRDMGGWDNGGFGNIDNSGGGFFGGNASSGGWSGNDDGTFAPSDFNSVVDSSGPSDWSGGDSGGDWGGGGDFGGGDFGGGDFGGGDSGGGGDW